MNDHLSNRQVLYGPCVPLFNTNPYHDPNNGQFTSAEGSLANKQKRQNIDRIARSNEGKTDWAQDVKKDNFPARTNKCNKFVYDVLKNAGIDTKIKDRPPMAGEWADKNTQIPNWRLLKPGEKPQPGDVAAYKLPGGGTAFSGHTGIITSDNRGGTSNMSAHHDVVGTVPGQFDSTQRNPVTYRRYTGK